MAAMGNFHLKVSIRNPECLFLKYYLNPYLCPLAYYIFRRHIKNHVRDGFTKFI